ncbi:MAG: DEAD/DEAH box helicase [Pseudomonadota bacterium]
MNIPKTDTHSPTEKYATLPPASKAIIQLLAVNVDYCRTEVVLSFLINLHFTNDEGRQFTFAGLQQQLKELAASGLLLKNNMGVCCPQSIRHLAFSEALAKGTFAVIVQYLQQALQLPTKLSGKYHHQGNYQRLLRDFQIALFHFGSLEEVNDLVYHYTYSQFNDDYYENNPFLFFLNRPFSADIIEKIDPKIRLELLANLLHAADNGSEQAKDIIAYIVDKYSHEIPNKTLASTLLMHYLLSGDTAKFHSLLDRLGDDLQLAKLYWTGCLAVVNGDFPMALQAFSKSDQLLKKLTGKRKMVLTNYAGIFQLVALLQTNEPTALKEALESLTFAQKNRDNYPLLPLMELLLPIFQDKLGMVATDQFADNLHFFRKIPIAIFFSQLFKFWKNCTNTSNDIPLLQQARDKALTCGHKWIAAELSALLATLGHDVKVNRKMAASFHASCSTTSFVDIIRLQPQWEKVLNSLLYINKPDQDKKKGGTSVQRLIWLFSFNEQYHYCRISAKFQKMTAKGSWTGGSPIALKRLYHEYHGMPELSDQDRQVCRAIREESYRSGWGSHTRTEYAFDRDKVLPALVGHSLLFLEESPGVNVELVTAEPELHFREEKGELLLTVTPSFTDETGNLLVVKDTPTRFKIIRYTAEHKHVINLLGTGMTIPKAGETLARQVVDKLSTFIAVHSDLDGTNSATAVAADSRPHAHILPLRDGISLEFLVKPISTGNSSFRPGKGSKNVTAVTDGKAVQAVRDPAEEKQRLVGIIKACPTLNRLEASDNQWQAEDPEDALELLLELRECGDDVVMEWPQGEKLKVQRQVGWNNFSLRIAGDHDWFKATGTLTIDDTLALDLRRLLGMLSHSTGRFIPLDDGTFLALTKSLHKRLQELQAYSEGHGEGVRFAPLAALALEDFTREAGQLQSDKAWKEHCRRLAETDNPTLPSTLRADLRDYQATGFRWLARLSSWEVGACLADDMGLGKTVQALAAILLRAAKGPTLVVAPLSVTSNWQDEADRFAPTLKVIVFGPGDRNQVINNLQPFDLLVVSYGLLPLEAELLASVSWQTVVLDEAQAIKNMQTKRSKAAMGLRAKCRIITTGTPLENHLGELWTLFNFLNPGLLGSFKKFIEKYAIPIERDHDQDARNHLRKLIRPFILRRLKSDVLQELPAKTEITLEVEMSAEEQLLYEAQRQKALETIKSHQDEEAGPQHLRILAEIMKLRRLCCNPSLLLPEADITSSKLQVFADTLRELLDNKHKALIFSQFVDHLGIIRNYLDGENISYQYLDGSTPIKERKERINNFQNGIGDVFLISLKAGGAGLNLTAADYVIHMDPWWNPAVEDQASDRAHRIGQERPVTVYRLVMKGSIEQQIVNLHKQKRDLADSLLEGTDAAGKISAPELLALLHGEKT